MNNVTIKFVITLVVLTVGFVSISAQNSAPIITSDAQIADNLDLYAVAELFKDSENLEKFEQALNNPAKEINNLDLNNDGAVDFICVTEQVKNNTHLIILQTALGENEFQDVATIAVEQEDGGKYNLQLQGDASIYGANYYIVPANDNFSAWDVVRWLFRPNYRVYVSPYAYRNFPRWWSVRRPLAVSVYRTRIGAFAGRRNFVTTKTVTVRSVNKIDYRPRASVLVTRRSNVTRANNVTTNPRPVVHTRTVTTTKQKNGVQTTQTKTNTRIGGSKRGKN